MRITDWSGGQDDLEAPSAEAPEALLACVDSLLGEAVLVAADLLLVAADLLLADVDLMPEDFLVLGVQLQQQTLMGCTVVLEESH